MYHRLIERYLAANQSFFLLGPRGTGKTTWLKEAFPQAIFIDLLKSSTYTKLLNHPDELEILIPPGHKDWIILDEIQKIPQLLNEVHRLIENKKLRFILTGSSARSLRKKGVNLLAGRALTYHLYPLTVAELGKDYNLDQALRFGQLPYVFQAKDKTEYLASYIQTYLREEVLQEGLTRSIVVFSRFLELASFSQAGLLNYSEIAREAGVDRKTIENYFQILEDLLIGYRLAPFTKKAKRRLITGDKFFYFDVGIYRSLRPTGPLDTPEDISGAALETLLFQELKALNDYYGLGYSIYYWRTSNGTEVDFILYGENIFWAIEVKRSSSLRGQQLNGLRSFKQDYPQAKCHLVSGVKQREYIDDIEIWPIQDFLANLPTLLKNRAKR